MSYTMIFQKTAKLDGVNVGRTESYAPTRVVKLQETIPASSTDLEFVIGIDLSKLVALAIEVSADMTIETNSGSTPDDTLTLNEDSPLVESVDDLAGFTITADITSIFVTSVAGGTLKLIAGMVG